MNQLQNVPLRIGNRDLIAMLSVQPEGSMVAIRPICEAIGLAKPEKQYERLANDPKFTPLHMESRDSLGRSQVMFCLPIEQIGGWLYSINSNKVKPEVREQLLHFQQVLTKELYAIVIGKVSSEKTEALEKQVQFLTQELLLVRQEMQQDRKMFLEILTKQQGQIDLHNVMAGQEQTLASMGGKLMSRAKATKYLRKVLHNQ